MSKQEKDIADLQEQVNKVNDFIERRVNPYTQPKQFDGTKLFMFIIPSIVMVMSIGALYLQVEDNTEFRKTSRYSVLVRDVEDNTEYRKAQGSSAINFTNLSNTISNIETRDIPELNAKIDTADGNITGLGLRLDLVSEEIVVVREQVDTELVDASFVVDDLRQQVAGLGQFKRQVHEITEKYNRWATRNNPTGIVEHIPESNLSTPR